MQDAAELAGVHLAADAHEQTTHLMPDAAAAAAVEVAAVQHEAGRVYVLAEDPALLSCLTAL